MLYVMQIVGSLLLALAAATALPAHAISSEAVASMATSKLPGPAPAQREMHALQTDTLLMHDVHVTES